MKLESHPSKTKKLVLIGAGEFAAIAYEYFTHDSEYEVLAYSVEKNYLDSTNPLNLPVVAFEDLESEYAPGTVELFVAIPASDLNATRTRLYNASRDKGYKLASYVSSRCFCWHNVKIGDNTFIFENNTLQPFTSIGNNVVMWSGNHLGHRSVIEDHCFISSHVVISGYCTIGHSSFIGVNATLNDGISIPSQCIIAAGTHVTKTLKEEGRVYRGAPAAEVPRLDARKLKL
ncbi:acetyltransferase [Devosia sp. BK]|uniref:acetyltransferase n=1 Tax=Devosia sp. BK TaxID=2871706 RepID=UPI00293AEEFF|nr:acetyltransferase [Devosia sp. BK]MDV3253796.1 acetyltransferase [Devosia sp. BK]